jgi:glucuronate isomerase
MLFTDEFLLQSQTAKDLYNEVKKLPIIDYHNHLSAQEIYENKAYGDITEMWLKYDHYKWRLMRFSGVNEQFITGKCGSLERFVKFAESLERAYLNPLYHWSHMELKQYFNIDQTLTLKNATELYSSIMSNLNENPRGPYDLLKEMNVEALCTTDGVNDSLEFHDLINKDNTYDITVLPTFRPDALVNASLDHFDRELKLLEKNTGITISGITSLTKALSLRLDYFAEKGCRLADHGISELRYIEVTKENASLILKKRILGDTLQKDEQAKLSVYLLKFFLKEYARRGWMCQYHMGALRNANQVMFKKLGRDAGFDSISGSDYIEDLNQLLSDVSSHYELPRMVLYNLNPRDNEAIASICGNFSLGAEGKIQFGASWWFNDHYKGIVDHLETFGTYLNLDKFIGMLTDSRSYTSFVRHDYFRRIMCNFLANKIELGFIPNDFDYVKELAKNISYNNVKKYLSL